MLEFKDFSRPLSDFPVFFKADLNFKDFSSKPSNASTFQACANPGQHYDGMIRKIIAISLLKKVSNI